MQKKILHWNVRFVILLLLIFNLEEELVEWIFFKKYLQIRYKLKLLQWA